jgi:CHC2-type zinc finger protein
MGAFQRERLPHPRFFYEREGLKPGRPNRKGWALAATGCLFHKSKSRKSFFLNLNSGAYKCFGCDAKGGDLVSFVMQRSGLSFKEAAQSLGAWDGHAAPNPLSTVPVRTLVLDYVIDGVPYRAQINDEPRSYREMIRRFYRQASDRLTELSQGDSESYVGEREDCWARMACALDEIREMETT